MKYTLPLISIIAIAFMIAELGLGLEVFIGFMVTAVLWACLQLLLLNYKLKINSEAKKEVEYLSVELGKTERIKENLEKQLLSTKQHYQNKINDYQESSIQQLRERAKERRLEVEDA